MHLKKEELELIIFAAASAALYLGYFIYALVRIKGALGRTELIGDIVSGKAGINYGKVKINGDFNDRSNEVRAIAREIDGRSGEKSSYDLIVRWMEAFKAKHRLNLSLIRYFPFLPVVVLVLVFLTTKEGSVLLKTGHNLGTYLAVLAIMMIPSAAVALVCNLIYTRISGLHLVDRLNETLCKACRTFGGMKYDGEHLVSQNKVYKTENGNKVQYLVSTYSVNHVCSECGARMARTVTREERIG